MAITVTGSTLFVTLSNATDLELGGHLTWTADNTKDIGASGANRPRTGYYGTSVVTPSVTNAGTLALSATGANVITLSTNGSERGRVSSAGNLLVGTTTDDGASKLQVAGNISNVRGVGGSLTLYESDLTRANRFIIGADATSAYINTTFGAGGTTILRFLQSDAEVARFASSNNLLVGGTTDGNYRLDVQSGGSAGTFRCYDQTPTTGVTNCVVRAGAGQSTNAVFNITANDGTTSVFKVLETKIGFFNATPVVKQTVTADAASILAALQAYGLAV